MKNYLVQYLSHNERRFYFVWASSPHRAWMLTLWLEATPLNKVNLKLEKVHEGQRATNSIVATN